MPEDLLKYALEPRFVPDELRELLSKARHQGAMVFALENLPLSPKLTEVERAQRRSAGPFADMTE